MNRKTLLGGIALTLLSSSHPSYAQLYDESFFARRTPAGLKIVGTWD